ncbi:MAG: response regulator transcription factor [Flavobacteriales bacterium]|nr:response regulator transcription factor [Flavobacteriales bacterium]MCX7651131.1 response regulator transcription factor [Flavobacteriales bacterium]MDW8431325.1 response regulator transcription factor [Flavobacteriales bacterium]
MQVLIVEDDPRMASLLIRSLTEAGYSVEWASDAQVGGLMLQNKKYDLLITDILLPGTNGLEFCRQLRQRYPHLPVLMLTALGATDDKVEGFDAGADDYMVKPFELKELLARVRALLNRSLRKPIPETAYRCGDLELNPQTQQVFRNGKLLHLTPKEFKLLKFMLENAGRVISKKEISEKVWGIDFDTGTNFVDVYINYLRRKVDKEFGRKLIQTRPGAGYYLDCSPPSSSAP